MRKRLDCAVLVCSDAGPHGPPPGTEAHARGRLVLHHLPLSEGPADSSAILAVRLVLKRFDACMLQVSACNLPWVRQALSTAAPHLGTPVIGLLQGLTAPAIADLYHCGMADFLRHPLCHEELRIRIARLVSHRTMSGSGGHYPKVSAPPPEVAEASLAGSYEESGDHELEAFAIASANRCAHTEDSFAIAKRKVISRFEQAYLRASLAKSSGNITLAARRAKKHRRAYWALLKKHAIDAEPYRKGRA